MKILSTTAAGVELQTFGVSAAHLDSTTFWGWRKPFIHGGITLILPFGKAIVIIESRYLRKDDSGELIVDRQIALLRHELCHVQQGEDWGMLTYWRRHIWARITSRSMGAKETDVERCCYDALREVAAKHPVILN
jgi:hypothetical protein